MPSQFSFQVSVEVGDDLKQIGSELKALTLEASQRAEEAGGNGIMAGLATAADHLGRNAHLLKSHLQSQTSQSKSHAKELGKYFRKHGREFVAAGARTAMWQPPLMTATARKARYQPYRAFKLLSLGTSPSRQVLNSRFASLRSNATAPEYTGYSTSRWKHYCIND